MAQKALKAKPPAAGTAQIKAKPAKKGLSPFLFVAVIGAVAVVALVCWLAAGKIAWSMAQENLGEAVSPRAQPKSWRSDKNATFMTMNTLDDMLQYERLLLDNGGLKAVSGPSQTVIQMGLTDVLLRVGDNGEGEVMILPGKTIAWPQNAITRSLPRPPAGTLVGVDQRDAVSSSYVIRRVSESQARNYVSNLVEAFDWVIQDESNYLDQTGPFIAALTKDATTMLVDYYANAAGFVIYIEMS